MYKLFFLLFYFSISISISQNKDTLLKKFYAKNLNDSIRFEAMHSYAKLISNENIDSAIKCGFIELELAKKSKLKYCEAKAYRLIGSMYNNKFDGKNGLIYFMKSLRLLEGTNDYKGLASTYNGLGGIYSSLNEPEKALDYRYKSVEYAEKSGDKTLMATCYMNIGGLLMGTDNSKSLEFKFKTIKIYEELKDTSNLALGYSMLGNTYFNLPDLKNAEKYYKKALDMARPLKENRQIAGNMAMLGGVFNNLNEYKTALAYLDSATQINKTKNNNDIWIGLTILKYKETSFASLKLYDKAYLIREESDAIEDSLFSEDKKKETKELAEKYENEKKVLEAEKQKITEREEKKRQTLITITISIVLIITIIFAGFIFNRFKLTKKQKQIIEIKSQETEAQKHLIEEKQKEIIESITYAKRLQEAILPPQEFIDKHLTNNFILYKPKDLVAGDFYWAEKINDMFFIAAADSTGHGVPGAMVSVVCSNALNRSIKEFNLTETGKILDKTRELVLETFEKSASEVKDGMDISLLCIDGKNKSIFWSGANNPLWFIQNGEFKEIKADKQPIGKTEYPKPFTTHQIEYKENTTFYLFTDGFADQFGGSKGKKFKYKQFSDLLINNINLTQKQQADTINKVFEAWKGNLEQVDDVCVIGIKI